MTVLNINNRKKIFTVIFFVIISLFFLYKGNFLESNLSEINPFLKEMPQKYSGLLKDAKKINNSYLGTIYEDGVTKELLIFKEFPTIDEQETDFNIQLFYTTSEQPVDTKKLELTNTNKAILYNYNNVDYGVFIKELPQVNLKKIDVTIRKYRTARTDWNTTLNNHTSKDEKSLIYKDNNYSSFSIPNPYTYYYKKSLDAKNIKHLPYSYSLKNDSLFQTLQSIEFYIKENNVSIAAVTDSNLFWRAMNEDRVSLISSSLTFLEPGAKQSKIALLKKNNIDSIFDISKLIDYFILKNIFTGGCNNILHFVLNKETGLLEPFYVDSNCLGEMAKIVNAPKLKTSSFVKGYIRAIDSLSREFLSITNEETYKKELALINSYYPNKIYDYKTLLVNQNLLSNSLFSYLIITAEFISITDKNLRLSIQNVSEFPLEIKGLNFKASKRISSLSPVEELSDGQKKIIDMPLPRSFENLFVHKKSKTTGFKLTKDIYDLRVVFSFIGLDSIHKVSIAPYIASEVTEDDLFRISPTINLNKELVVDQKKKEITFLDSTIIDKPLIIPSGYVLKANPGTKINILSGGKIISNSPLKFIGTKEAPIEIHSSDKKGQGILILAEKRNSYLKHVSINHLTNPTHGNWTVTGAITFYESPVKLEYVSISNNRSEDALNIVRTNFFISHCTLQNTQSDAFDGDFVDGIVKDSNFINLGNDAIDVSGSDITITNVTINKASDKGLSAGENSKMTINNVTIENSEIALAGKDLSLVEGKNLTIRNNKLAFTAFKKKPEFGPSHIKLTEVKLESVETIHLIENKSSLYFNGKEATTIKNVKSKMYGVEFGKSSK